MGYEGPAMCCNDHMDDTWKLKFRLLRQRLVDKQTHYLEQEGMYVGLGWAIEELDEILGQSEEERLK